MTPAQEIFAQQIALGRTKADAYRTAYPKARKWKKSSVHADASRLAAKREIAERIQKLQAELWQQQMRMTIRR
ncbi:MAG: hypothetical protein LBU11_06955 [Zoogloeaceae bacterium]|jgi:hypothetical protein|nr:hypothetical protein [Zoogloeaceae bacterium]